MGDDSTPIDSRQEADGDAQRASLDDEAPTDGGTEHPVEVLPNVTREEVVNGETKTVAGDVGEVVGEAEKNVGVDQQVQHLSYFLFISVISYFFISVIFYIH
jgi:hypothetical protein